MDSKQECMTMVIADKFIQNTENTSPLLDFLVKKDLQDIEDKSDVYQNARNDAWNDPVVKNIVRELKLWPGNVLKRHNDAKLLIHKLSFLADIGFTIHDEGMKEICDSILRNRSPEGVFQVLVNIPGQFGGTGIDSYSWMLCDAPLLMYSLLKMGVDRKILNRGIDYLISLGGDMGYPCAASSDLGKFNGPGKRGTLCPYGDLLMVRLFSLLPEKHNDIKCRSAVEALLDHIEKKDKRYLFGIGTDFQKLKFPFIWYDVLHFTEVLSHFEYTVSDPRFISLVHRIEEKADEDGLYRAESVWMAWKQIDSGQKKESSLWISFIVLRILKRIGEWREL